VNTIVFFPDAIYSANFVAVISKLFTSPDFSCGVSKITTSVTSSPVVSSPVVSSPVVSSPVVSSPVVSSSLVVSSPTTTSDLPVSGLVDGVQPKKLNAKRALAINNNFFIVLFTPN
jgi:hypothetical protein